MTARYTLPNYILYFDTSVAYSRKPAEAISSKLLKFLKTVRERTNIDVRVPEVVIQELAYQQFVLGQAAAQNLSKNSQTLLETCGISEVEFPNDATLKDGAHRITTEAIAVASISTLKTPLDTIDWGAVVHDSCWRRPPFQKPCSKDDLAEKGFRDRIILETILADAAKVQDRVIAFVSSDNLLRATFSEQISSKTECDVEAYLGFEEFVGHLDLLLKTRSQSFVEDVSSRVGAIFYDPNDPNCVVFSKGVSDYLTRKYSDDMAVPSFFTLAPPKYGPKKSFAAQADVPERIAFERWLKDHTGWIPASEIKMFASPPIFQPNKHAGTRYHWLSTITLARLLQKVDSRAGSVVGWPEERILTKDIDVGWSCEIDSNTAKFSDFSVDSYADTLRGSFVQADFWSRSAYGFPMFPGAGPSMTDSQLKNRPVSRGEPRFISK